MRAGCKDGNGRRLGYSLSAEEIVGLQSLGLNIAGIARSRLRNADCPSGRNPHTV